MKLIIILECLLVLILLKILYDVIIDVGDIYVLLFINTLCSILIGRIVYDIHLNYREYKYTKFLKRRGWKFDNSKVIK